MKRTALTVDLDPALRRRLKRVCVDRDVSMSAISRNLLTDYVRRAERKIAAKASPVGSSETSSVCAS